jgi:hypothetical protein
VHAGTTATAEVVGVVGGAALGCLVGWFTESQGVHPQVTGFLGAVVTGLVAFAPRFIGRKRTPKEQKIGELVRGEIYEHPLLVVAYLVIGLQMFQRLLGALIGGAMGLALADYDVADEDIASVVAAASPLVVFTLSLPVTAYFAQLATYRLVSRPYFWIVVALAISVAVNLVVIAMAQDYVGQKWSVPALVGEGVIELVALGIAAYIGFRRAARRRRAYLMSRLFPKLAPDEQRALIDLVETLPRRA